MGWWHFKLMSAMIVIAGQCWSIEPAAYLMVRSVYEPESFLTIKWTKINFAFIKIYVFNLKISLF